MVDYTNSIIAQYLSGFRKGYTVDSLYLEHPLSQTSFYFELKSQFLCVGCNLFFSFYLELSLSRTNFLDPCEFEIERVNCSCQHLLLRFTEKWRKYLDQNKIVGALLMDLSKAFDCLPHDLLIAKLEAYVFDTKTLSILKSYLNQRNSL